MQLISKTKASQFKSVQFMHSVMIEWCEGGKGILGNYENLERYRQFPTNGETGSEEFIPFH